MVTRVTAEVPDADPAAAPRYTETNESVWSMRVTQDAGQRWLTHRLLNTTLRVQGVQTEEPQAKALVGEAFSVAFGDRGQFIDLRGIEETLKKLRTVMGDKAPQEEQLTAFYRVQWMAGFGWMWSHLAGQASVPGVSWDQSDAAYVILGPWVGHSLAKGRWLLLGQVTPAADSPARVEFSYSTETVPLGEGAKAIKQWLRKRIPSLADRSWSSVKWEDKGVVLVDPLTLMISEGAQLQRVSVETEAPASETLRVDITTALKTTWVK